MTGKHARFDTAMTIQLGHHGHAPAHFDAKIFDLGWWPLVHHPDPTRMKRQMEKQSMVADIAPSREYQVDFWRSWAIYFAEAAGQSFEKWRAEKRLNNGRVKRLENIVVGIKTSMGSYETTITALQEKDRKNQQYIASLENQLRSSPERRASADQDSATPITPKAKSQLESDIGTPTSQPQCPADKLHSGSPPPFSSISTPASSGSSSASATSSSSASSSTITTPSSSGSSSSKFPAMKRVTKKLATPLQKSKPEADPFKSELATLSTQSKLTKVEELLERIQANDAVLHKLSKEALSASSAQLKCQATDTSITISGLQADLSKQRESHTNLLQIVRKDEKRLLNQTLAMKEMKQKIQNYEMKDLQEQQRDHFLDERVVPSYVGTQTINHLSFTCSDERTSIAIEPKDGGVVVLPKAAVDGFLAALGVENKEMTA